MNKKQLRALLILCGADTLLLVLVLVAMLKLGHPWEYIAAGYCILSSIPLALLGAFVFHWPVLLVYACTCLDEVGKIPWVMYRFRKYKWVQNLTQ